MVDKAKTKRVLKQFTPKRTALGKMGGQPLELPNFSKGKAPESDKDLANKKYVDDAGLWEVSGTDVQLKTARDINLANTFTLKWGTTVNDPGLICDNNVFGAQTLIATGNPTYFSLGAPRGLAFYSNVGTDGAGNWEPYILMNENGNMILTNALQGTAANRKLTLNFTSGVDVNNTKIANVLDPTADQEAATKKYVDDNAGSPAGNDTEIQFNDNGSFGASSNFTYDGTDLTFKGGQILADASDGGVGDATPTYSFWERTDTGFKIDKIGDFADLVFIANGLRSFTASQQRLKIRAGGNADIVALSIRDDANTGLFVPAFDTLGIAAGGKEFIRCVEAATEYMVFNEDGIPMYFRFEGDNDANLCYIDGYNDKVGIGTATPTTKFSVMEKSGMTPIGGFAIKLTNKTGNNSVAGESVECSVGTANAVQLASGDSLEPIGVFLDAGVSDGSEAWIVVSGIAEVLADAAGWSMGDWIQSSNTAGRCEGTAHVPNPAVHMQEVGHALEDAAGNALGKVVLHFN